MQHKAYTVYNCDQTSDARRIDIDAKRIETTLDSTAADVRLPATEDRNGAVFPFPTAAETALLPVMTTHRGRGLSIYTQDNGELFDQILSYLARHIYYYFHKSCTMRA